MASDPEYPRLSPWSTGLRCRCPRCGKGPLLHRYLKIRDHCPECALDYSFADPADGPAFFGMSIVGVIGMMAFMAFEFTVQPPIWVHMVVTLPLLALSCLAVLPPLKGWLVAEQYVHKAAPPEFESVGRHGEGYGWKGQAERAARRTRKDETPSA
ncbi:DUF983 domain-containing protein [Brevundimonas sp. S30B]|uniref:DUF983 domain-containing protein n=1 Tax=unclassified Brevundimonas TaxID=2622653 RepID=UPI001071B0F0|nr:MULTISPECIES: DUF983 domain-containing protein [unclassified Brevundimonas]QBX39014.1 DUF983 domain-containing protein [Brevundimonas sp. MF30-B]TFW02276.1 DUF983 domain-containing protein [Brevundimonas sp. S30B]